MKWSCRSRVGRRHRFCKRALEVPAFLAYTEKPDGPKQPKKLLKYKEMWKQIKNLHPMMTFTQKQVESAMKAAAVECQKSVWPRKLSDVEMKEWSCSISKQFRSACRHIMQSPKTAWFRQMFAKSEVELVHDDDEDDEEGGDDGEEGEAEAGEGEEEETKAESEPDGEGDDEEEEEAKDEAVAAPSRKQGKEAKPAVPAAKKRGQQSHYFVKWDSEMANVYRVLSSASADTPREWAMHCCQENSSKWALAHFADGTALQVVGLTMVRYEKARAMRSEKGKNTFFDTKMANGDRIIVAFKKEGSRGALVCMYKETFGKEKSQLCQFKVGAFGGEDDVFKQANGFLGEEPIAGTSRTAFSTLSPGRSSGKVKLAKVYNPHMHVRVCIPWPSLPFLTSLVRLNFEGAVRRVSAMSFWGKMFGAVASAALPTGSCGGLQSPDDHDRDPLRCR